MFYSPLPPNKGKFLLKWIGLFVQRRHQNFEVSDFFQGATKENQPLKFVFLCMSNASLSWWQNRQVTSYWYISFCLSQIHLLYAISDHRTLESQKLAYLCWSTLIWLLWQYSRQKQHCYLLDIDICDSKASLLSEKPLLDEPLWVSGDVWKR